MASHTKTQPQEWVAYHKSSGDYGIDFIHANFVTHRFSRHVHDYFVLGIIESGFQTFDYRHAKHRTAPSGIIILNPDEPHTGESASPTGFGYKAMYPSVSLLRRIVADTEDLFSTGNDEDNRAAVKAVKSEDLKLTGLALRENKKLVDTALKGLSLHR